MCGICGILNRAGAAPIEPTVIRAMTDSMQHRGPDEDGYYFGSSIGLGHRRLSIIDLATGQQPVYNEDRRIVVVLNGEIYNYRDLRPALEASGHVFRTASDTETIVHAYEEYGEKCVQHFRGMFSFALWDMRTKTLLLARDRLGKKPLYYALAGDRLAFASEIKSILKSGLVHPETDVTLVDQFLSLGYIVAPRTLFKNINKVPPGHLLIARAGTVQVREYWFLEDRQPGTLSHRESEEGIVARLQDAVRYRMISDVPLGAFLSGGIDSSIVVGLMSQFSSRPVRTFSVGYRAGDGSSELDYARTVARHFGTEHREIILEPADFHDVVPKMVWHVDEPVGDQACIPLWQMSREARRHVTVLLSGEGADELFAGYPVYALMQGIGWYRRLPAWCRRWVTDPLLPKIFGQRRGEKYREWGGLPLEERFLGDMADLSGALRRRLYAPGLLETALKNRVAAVVQPYYARAGGDALARMQYLDIKTWLADDLLLKADKMTMAASVELRCPFLDHELVEFARAIPSRLKLRGSTTKYILKHAFRNFLPPAIVHRKKQGFPVPLSAWFAGDLRQFLQEVLLDRRSLARGYFNEKFIQTTIASHAAGTDDYSKLLWSLVVLELWQQQFIDTAGNHAQ